MGYRGVILALVLTLAGTAAAIGAGNSLIDEFGHCRPLKASDNQDVALRVVLGWGFEGIRHTSEPASDGSGRKWGVSTDNSWKVTVYKNRKWLLSRGRSRQTGKDTSVQEVCVILGGTSSAIYTQDEFSSEKQSLTP